MIIPRDYQEYALPAWLEWVAAGKGDPVLVYPTGVGKSVILALIITHCLKNWPGTRSMVLTHSKELIQQDYDKLKTYWETAPAGIYSEGLKRREYWNPITIAGIQSVFHQPELFGKIDLLFIDECDLISLKDQSMYRQFIDKMRIMNPHLVVTGLTATPWRSGQGLLWEGENALFSGAAVDACSLDNFNWFLDEGYLVPPVAKKTAFQYDTSKVKTTAGEFNQKDLEAAVNQMDINERVVLASVEEFKHRQHGLTFCTGIKHVENVAEIYNHYGVHTTFVHSKMKEGERDKRIEAFKAGDWQMMVNNGILTTGFDDPLIDFMSMMKATKSSRLFVQMLGRGTRPYFAPGFDLSTKDGRLAAIANSFKQNFLVLDFAKNTERLGPINDPLIPQPKGGKKRLTEAPIRICDNCGTYNHASVMFCSLCNFEFPRKSKIEDKSSGVALVKKSKIPPLPDEPITADFDVTHVSYSLYHKSVEKPPTMKVVYQCGYRSFDEWIHFESNAFRGKAVRWWMDRTGCQPTEVPLSTAEALKRTDELKIPLVIKVHVNTKYPMIKGYDYGDPAAGDRVSTEDDRNLQLEDLH